MFLCPATLPVFAADEVVPAEGEEEVVVEKRGFFSRKKPASALDGKGYVGKLPEVSKPLPPTETGVAKPFYESTEDFHSANQVKPAPRDNPAFVNIILKSDRNSPYLNDINNLLPIIDKVYDCIENNATVQQFNSAVYFYNKNADYLRDKYDKKPESYYISFRKILQLSLQAQTIALLRSEALKYNPYLAYGGAGAVYDTSNITKQLEYLKIEIEQTVIAIKEAE